MAAMQIRMDGYEVVEKIVKKGTTANERIMSLITTWKQPGLNPFYELKALI